MIGPVSTYLVIVDGDLVGQNVVVARRGSYYIDGGQQYGHVQGPIDQHTLLGCHGDGHLGEVIASQCVCVCVLPNEQANVK